MTPHEMIGFSTTVKLTETEICCRL